MIITRKTVSNKLLAYLNQEMTLAELVNWAENTFIDASLEPEEDIEVLNNILSYLAAADSKQFPLTWDICTQFLNNLGVTIQVTVTSQAS